MTNPDLIKRILAAQHAVQTGIATQLAHGIDAGTSGKDLRVGVNSAMVFQQAIASLLILKGVFTDDEYAEACAVAMEQEKLRYEAELRKHFDNPGITLG